MCFHTGHLTHRADMLLQFQLRKKKPEMTVKLTRVDSEEPGGAAEVLPGERRILLVVTDEDVV